MLSRKFRITIKLANEPAYKIAQRANVDPNFLSKVLRGIVTVQPGDERLVRVCKVLDIHESECFESNKNED